MIILYHNHNKVVEVVLKEENESISFSKNETITSVLVDLSTKYPESKIVWCHEDYRDFLNLEEINNLSHHNKVMLSYNPNAVNYLSKKIGYVDQSLFIKINKEATYPTWQMSSCVGIIHASVLVAFHKKVKYDSNFDYFLISLAKLSMPSGLLCYSEKKILKEGVMTTDFSKPSNFTLFKFVKQHYRTRWMFLLLLNLTIYEFKFPFVAFLYGCFFKSVNKDIIQIEDIDVKSSLELNNAGGVDVIIPTIGRKIYLYDFLKDLAKQTYLPDSVIIVEQNSQPGSVSELHYLSSEVWPFKIKHFFTNQAGACNARNLALEKVENEWIFFADDDIRIEQNFLESAFEKVSKYKNKVLTFSCLLENQKEINQEVFQWGAFGSGCSLVKKEVIKNIKFDLKYEFGFGEDSDFGMQIRKQGYDVLYFPYPHILHLKAPIGGFRTKPDLAWSNDKIKPKPSPTILLYKLLHETKEQLNGYKTLLFFKYYSRQSIKNPFRYFSNFQKEWKQSLYWANKLINNS